MRWRLGTGGCRRNQKITFNVDFRALKNCVLYIRSTLNVILFLAFSIVNVVRKQMSGRSGQHSCPDLPLGVLVRFDDIMRTQTFLSVFFASADDLILVPISVFDGAQQSQVLKFENKPSNCGVGRIAKILLQLLGGELGGAIGRENEVP